MRRIKLLLALPLLVACGKSDAPATDTTAMAAAPAAMNVAGTWKVDVMPEGKDTVLLTYTLLATNDRTGWKLTLPNMEPMEPRITSMDGDSIVIENGPYSSALRKNVMVTTHSTMHLEGDKLVGSTIARYNTTGPDSVLMLRTSGTRQ